MRHTSLTVVLSFFSIYSPGGYFAILFREQNDRSNFGRMSLKEHSYEIVLKSFSRFCSRRRFKLYPI